MAAVALLMLLALASGCSSSSGSHVTGSGVPATKQYALSGFTGVRVDNDFSATVTRGVAFRVEVTADDNLAKYLQVEVRDGTLHVGLAPDTTYYNTTLKAKITLPSLASLELAGASEAHVSGFTSTGPLALTLSGATLMRLNGVRAGVTTVGLSGGSTLEGGLTAQELDATASGASQVKLAGSAHSAKLEASGASEYALAAFTTKVAMVTLSGASKAGVRVTGTLSVNLTGASAVDYYGPAILRTVNVGGASQINHIGG